MLKQLNVSLNFQANIEQAKRQIQELQSTLTQIAKMPGNASSLFDDTSIRKASQAALELQQHLSRAVNVDTGKLDLSRFSSSLKASKQDLHSYANTLLSIGPTGQQAFLQLAQAISTADVPVTRINAKVKELGVTLKNTAKWQLSSSLLHGFMGAIQSAYGYAQDLNSSLNDIRIVTGESAESMAEFAERANRAAKALSTTTTDYTNASLIFYQQGLSDDEVEARTNVTIKMANAAGESAEKISDQLTAVWNNFYDGSKSLEYYADVMTALGAATASSTDEIAGGLEKFAAIGQTIGLSYEYAASALATITSNTRQSEEVVGTALKTIFARIQGLNLGETLEDGVTLNKYSDALAKIGVSIFDSTGELKKMDNILDEMADKWDVLSKAEQTALAQTVAGVRQYTQLVALMENWNKGDSDSMVANLKTSYDSEGTVSNQADIYAQSWEAASDRVTAAAENIYDSLINDEFFIGILNGFEKILETVGGFIDGLGGLKGIILTVGSIFLTNFAQKMPEALSNLRQNMMIFTGQSKKAMVEMQDTLQLELTSQMADPRFSDSYKIQAEGISKVTKMKQQLVTQSKHLNSIEKQEYESKIQNVQMMYDEIAALIAKKEAAEKAAQASEKQASKTAKRGSLKVFNDYNDSQANVSSLKQKATTPGLSQNLTDHYEIALEQAREKAKGLKQDIAQIGKAAQLSGEEIQALMGVGSAEQMAAAQDKVAQAIERTSQSFSEQIKKRTNLEGLGTAVRSQATAWEEVAKSVADATKAGVKSGTINKTVDSTKQKMAQYLKVVQKLAKENGISISSSRIRELSKAIDKMDADNIEEVTGKFSKFAEKLSSGVDRAIDNLDVSIDELREDMASLQFKPEMIDQIEQSAEEAADSVRYLDDAMDNVDGIADEPIEGTFKLSTALTEAGSLAMSVSSMITSVQSAISVWSDENASGFEKFGAALSLIMPIMTTFNSLQALSTTLSKQDKIAKLGAAAGQMAANVAAKLGIGVKTAETGAVVANTAAWYANPIMWIALIIVGVIAVVALLVAGIAKLTEALIKGDKIETENCDTLIENAEKTKELAEANKELSDSMDDLITEFEDLSAKGENTSEVLNKISEQMPALIQSYRDFAEQTGLEGLSKDVDELEKLANLGALTGDYSAFEEKKEEVDKQVDIATASAAKSGAVNANTKLAAAMQEEQGKAKGTKYTLHVGGSEGAGAERDERDAVDILNEEMSDYVSSKTTRGISLTVEDYTDPLELVDYYEKMVAARDRMLNEMTQEQRAESDTFREINEMIAATSDAYAEAKEQADEYLQVAGRAIEAEVGSGENVKTMEDYLNYRNQFLKVAIEEYNMSEDQALSYLNQMDSLSRLNDEYALASTMLQKFSGLTEKQVETLAKSNPDQLKSYTEELAKNLSAAFGDLSDKEMAIAVNIAATSDSIEDFSNKMQQAMIESARVGYQESAQIAQTAMTKAAENGEIDLTSLLNDDNFVEYLEEMHITQETLLAESYERQYSIVSEFYNKVNTCAFDSYTAQQELYYQQMADMQNELAAYYAATSGAGAEGVQEMQSKYADLQTQLNNTSDENEITRIKQDMQELAAEFEETYHFNIESNAETLSNELDAIIEKIEEIQDKKIEMAMDWSGVDALEKGFEKAAEFTQMIKNDTKKVGDSYQMTAAQARQWLEFYPELGSIAKVTSDGLISMNAAEVDAFIAGKESELDASVDAKIKELEAQRAALQTELELKQKDLAAAQALAQGKLELENVSAQYLVDLRTNLTSYFMEQGMDEVTANAAALETMGMNEETYAQAVADACETNAENMTYAAEEGANAQVSSLSQLAQRWASFGSYLVNNIGTILLELGAAILDPTKSVKDVMTKAWNASAITVNSSGGHNYTTTNGSYTFDSTDTSQLTAAYQGVATPQLEATNAAIAELEDAIGSIDGQIAYLESLGVAGLGDYGSTDPDKKGSDKDKESKDLAEIADRYHEITREVSALEHQLELLGKEKERAFGAKKIQAMDKEIEAMEELAQKQLELYKAQQLFLALDKSQVQTTFSAAQFNEDGDISNYSDLVAQATGELNAARTTYNNSAQEDADKEALEAAEQRYEKQIAILEQYEETLDATRESEIALQDAYDNWQAAHFEKFSYKLELEIELNEDDLQRLDYYLNKTEDDFYQRAEGLALMTEKVNIYSDSLADNKTALADLEQLKAEEKISDAQYIEGLDSISDGLYSNLEALNALDKEMMHYYGDTLEAAQEELDKTTDQLEKQTSILEHYMTIIELMGKSTDYKKVGVILEGQAETTKNEMIAAQKEYELFAKEAEENYLKWQSAKTEEEAELYRKQYEASLTAADEAQEEFLSKAEAYGEALKAILENDLNQYAQDLENILTGGTSFDQMTTAMERAASLQEEYLTTTNKIYETNKLMNQAQQEIDKSNNTVAKQRLKQFIDETNQLQKKNKLSQYELEIQQAKYELLLAEIALEDAQSAKSQVRLQRDAEGNFGYVYTADQEKVNSAAQELADAQNELYNIALEGANDYAEKYQQTLNEMYDTLRDLHQQYLDGEFESEEEYQNAVLEAKKYYFDLLEDYSDLYTIAISTDARALEDSWTKEFNTMIFKTDEWRDKTEVYIQKVQDAFNRWDTQMDKIASATGVGGDLEDLEKSVSKITDESKSLIDTLTSPGGVIDAIQQEITTVKSATDAYALQRKEVQKLISDYEKLTDSILESKKAMAKEEEKKPTTKPPASTGGGGSGTGGSGTTGGGGTGTGGDGTPKKGDKVIFKSGKYYNSSDGQSPLGSKYLGEEVYITNINKRSWATHPYHISKGSTLGSGDLGWLKLDQISGYDTGGYTGSWGPYGKLAMLHEKELVLNSGDTENFLAGMQILDNIIQTIDLHTANTKLGRALQSPGFGGIGTDTLEQQVTIEASFPSVTSRTEIEEAFTTLVNRASQYANRK